MAKDIEEQRLDVDVDFQLIQKGERVFADTAWPDWEVSRTRSFLSKKGKPINSKLGKVRNFRLLLTKERQGSKFKASFSFSLEQHIGPWHLVDDGKVYITLSDRGGKPLYRGKLNRFAIECGGWRPISKNGKMDPDAFAKVANVNLSGKNLRARRC